MAAGAGSRASRGGTGEVQGRHTWLIAVPRACVGGWAVFDGFCRRMLACLLLTVQTDVTGDRHTCSHGVCVTITYSKTAAIHTSLGVCCVCGTHGRNCFRR